MAEEGRSAEPLGSSQQSQPASESKLKSALASATGFFFNFPLKFRRLSSSLRAAPLSSHRQFTTQDRPSKAMSTLSDAAVASPQPDTVLQSQYQQPGSIAGDTSTMARPGGLKENIPPPDAPVAPLARLSMDNASLPKNLAIQPPNPPGRTEEERQTHQHFTNEALEMARLALRTNETPVGCVLVHKGTIIAKGMNATNVTRNGTRHAEFMALVALLARSGKDKTVSNAVNSCPPSATSSCGDTESLDTDGNRHTRGHVYPYGQKLHPAEVVDKSIIHESILYVTVEPCVMCASLLRQLGIKKVFFGAVNDKFGGTGGVFSIHKNASPLDDEPDTPRGDGGNIETGYEAEGGWGRDEAVGLLRRFYVQENGRAPVPRKKEGRAARLAALERDVDGGSTSPTVPETGEPVTVPGSAAAEGEDIGALHGEAKPVTATESAVGNEEDSQAHNAELNPTGQVAVTNA